MSFVKKLKRRIFRSEKAPTNVTVAYDPEPIDFQIERALWGSVSHISVKVDEKRPVTINILMPPISRHMSAGPLSILYFAKFLVDNNFHVRFLIDGGENQENLIKILNDQTPDISMVVNKFEVESFSLQTHPSLSVSLRDMSVATLFTTAYAAKTIQSKCVNKRFIYFIQDDEREFFSASSLRCVAEESYRFDFYPIFSTDILKDYFLQDNVGGLKNKNVPIITQGCPANYYLPKWENFSKRESRKKFVFYARPNIPRNCFDYAMYLIIQAAKLNVFDEAWDLYGMGFPQEKDIKLSDTHTLHLIPNMPLKEYKERLSTFDVALSLMATPHPSMPPIDLALSGCVVVTNSYKSKTEVTMNNICKNIICAPLSVSSLLDALRQAVSMSNSISQRYDNAVKSNWPKTWDGTFTEKHLTWIKEIMGD